MTPFFPTNHPTQLDLEDDEEEGCGEVAGGGGGKKRRLGTEQVRALERCFEIENKLDPDRKARLAHELGLQARQVAVWFQNRRARWKTKQLERDFAALKSRYDALRLDFDSLRRDNRSLEAELAAVKQRKGGLTAMGGEGSSDSDASGVIAGESRVEGGIAYEAQKMFKIEEHCFNGEEEPCGAAFFSDEHVPTLGWLCADLSGGGGW